tara:strand:- start:552 stop:1085 length:534 start_codon:yes stop_codon:yes gene_type:complete
MALILLRHGEPKIASGVCYGQSDIGAHIPAHAALTGVLNRFDRPVSRLYSSPLRRCMDLSQNLAPLLNLQVQTDPRLSEIDFGNWEMQPWDNIPRDEIDLWASDVENARPHGGESVAQLMQRVKSYLADVAGKPGNVLAVSHLGVARVIAAILGYPEPFELTLDFGDFLTFETDHIL